MEKDLITSGESRGMISVNGKPINPRTFEKLLEMANIKPVFIVPGTGVRLFSRKHIALLAKKLPRTLRRGEKLNFKRS